VRGSAWLSASARRRTRQTTRFGRWPRQLAGACGARGLLRDRNLLRFSLAAVQLKFSAVKNAGKNSGLTIPAEGVGGSWIVKLPSERYPAVPENEFSMMTLARRLNMDVPEVQLIELDAIEGLPEGIGHLKGQALAVRRFDRMEAGPVHFEDFAQVFGVWPEDKYKRASARNIATVIGVEAGDDAAAEFIRRLVFNTLIGNAEMHLKNWSLIYPDRRAAALAPAYDFVSTVSYIPDEFAAIKYARSKRMSELSFDELRYLAAKAHLPEKLVIDTASKTLTRFRDEWPAAKQDLPIDPKVAEAIETHMKGLALLTEKPKSYFSKQFHRIRTARQNDLCSAADRKKRSNHYWPDPPLNR
jgi:serine/threonine-protein kinase HipA